MPETFWEDQEEAYDYRSSMHYNSDAFLTKEAKDAGLFSITRKDNGEAIFPAARRLSSIDTVQ